MNAGEDLSCAVPRGLAYSLQWVGPPEQGRSGADPSPTLVTLSIPFQAPGMAATGMEATQRLPATVSVCFSLSELGKKLQFSSHGLS